MVLNSAMPHALGTVLVLLVTLSHAKLVFPAGSDVGYIVTDAAAELEAAEALLPDTDPQYNELKQQQLLSRRARGGRETGRLSGTQDGRPSAQTGDAYSSLWLPHDIVDTKDFVASSSGGVNSNALPSSLADTKHGVKMGVKDARCDDAKTGLLQDWDYSPANYTCYTPRLTLPRDYSTSMLHCQEIAKEYTPQHHCMDTPIRYSARIPSFGDHRPLWPQFGEYKFLPVQRWLHSIEHGTVVVLYHPCTAPHLVNQLRGLVRHCTYKYIMTPYTPLTPSRPMALVAWGCVLEMSTLDIEEVKAFIRQRALKGPEGILRKQGTFTEGLVGPSVMPDGKLDTGMALCPE